jgi:hypothetical protein
MLVLVRRRMSAALLARFTPEDVWQEAHFHAWRDRHVIAWQGVGAFCRRILTIIEHRLHDFADDESAQKRAGSVGQVPADRLAVADGALDGPLYARAVASPTPSRAARDREMDPAMNAAHGAAKPQPRRLHVPVRLVAVGAS